MQTLSSFIEIYPSLLHRINQSTTHASRVKCTLTWRATARHLHVELNRVHAQDGVANMTEHIVAGFHTHERWQLQELLQLWLPSKNQIRWEFDKGRLVSFWISWKGFKTKTDLLGSERSMLVPNLMIFPTDFCSELERRINLQGKIFNTVKGETLQTDHCFVFTWLSQWTFYKRQEQHYCWIA